ncbi:uncharacterized protein LOC142586912 [Dermacentor variabilis]|uniref:uncharacterized protein LOC142586912 n=1 Tax=Dermacentor variabilis TaxID=34621 RepID=UPI003F5B4651
MEATLSPFGHRTRRRCSSPLSTVVSVSPASSSSLVRCASESALQQCGAPPSTPVATAPRRVSRADSERSERPSESSTSEASRGHREADSRPHSVVVRRRSASCSARSSLASTDDYPGAPRPSLIVKMNACALLRQGELV